VAKAHDSKQSEINSKKQNSFKLAKNWISAGNAYMEAATCYAQTTYATYEAATCYVNAATCFAKEENMEAAVKAMQRCGV